MKPAKTVAQRLARYSASVVFIAGVGVVFLVGAVNDIPIGRLWIPLFWGGVASLFLGWAVGHAAGRLVIEMQTPVESDEKQSDVVEENHE